MRKDKSIKGIACAIWKEKDRVLRMCQKRAKNSKSITFQSLPVEQFFKFSNYKFLTDFWVDFVLIIFFLGKLSIKKYKRRKRATKISVEKGLKLRVKP